MIFDILSQYHQKFGLSVTVVMGYVCILSIFVFLFLFGLGITTIQWFIAAELMPQNAR